MNVHLKRGLLVLVTFFFFLFWHDVVASEDSSQYSYQQFGNFVNVTGISENIGGLVLSPVGAGHDIEVGVSYGPAHYWLLDIIPLTDIVLFTSVLPFYYNLVPIYLSYIIVLCILFKPWRTDTIREPY